MTGGDLSGTMKAAIIAIARGVRQTADGFVPDDWPDVVISRRTIESLIRQGLVTWSGGTYQGLVGAELSLTEEGWKVHDRLEEEAPPDVDDLYRYYRRAGRRRRKWNWERGFW